MTMTHKRMSVYLPAPAASVVREIAEQRDISDNDVVRLAIGLMQVVERARLDGHYVGVARDRDRLDTVMVTPL